MNHPTTIECPNCHRHSAKRQQLDKNGSANYRCRKNRPAPSHPTWGAMGCGHAFTQWGTWTPPAIKGRALRARDYNLNRKARIVRLNVLLDGLPVGVTFQADGKHAYATADLAKPTIPLADFKAGRIGGRIRRCNGVNEYIQTIQGTQS